jgi:transcription initiation factor IIE alpha subunit
MSKIKFEGKCPYCKTDIRKEFNDQIIKQDISLGFVHDDYSWCNPDEWGFEKDYFSIWVNPAEYPDNDEDVFMLSDMNAFECPNCKRMMEINTNMKIKKDKVKK